MTEKNPTGEDTVVSTLADLPERDFVPSRVTGLWQHPQLGRVQASIEITAEVTEVVMPLDPVTGKPFWAIAGNQQTRRQRARVTRVEFLDAPQA